MTEIIQDWLGTRLGVLLDLTPQKFGRNTKDGVLLARLLYGYGVIPLHVLQRVKETKIYGECYENLKILKPWLDHIGAVQDESALQEVARGEGSSAISLFYAVYVNLERKDTLYYLLTQKERRYSENSCGKKFKVEWVPERQLESSCAADDNSPGVTFLKKSDMIDWHRTKCKEVVENIKKVKAKFAKLKKNKKKTEIKTGRNEISKPVDKCLMEVEDLKEAISSFERRHVQKCPNLTYSELIKLKSLFEIEACACVPNAAEAKNIVANIKHRKKSEVYARNFQENMQHIVLDEQWKDIADLQSKRFEDSVHEMLLKQSQYEKQMMSKLCQLRQRKRVFAENRKMIESLKTEQMDKEFDDELATKLEIKEAYLSNAEFEKEKLAEVHKKVYYEKVKTRREFINAECVCIVTSISDIAIRVSEIRRMTSCQVPKALMKDLKELFFRNLPIFDILNNYEELFVEDSKVNEEMHEENEGEEDILCGNSNYDQMKVQEKHRQNTLNETDFIDYMNLYGPWMVQLLFPDGTEAEVQQIVLGYVVHRLLEVKYPVPNNPPRVPIKSMKPKVVVQDLDGDAYKMLLDLMETNKILVVHTNDAINFVLSVYKEELSVVRDIDITFQNLTNKALQEKSNADKDKDVKKKVTLMKKEEPINRIEGTEASLLDKETQTPRMIPEDDPILSTNAAIGKLAFDALGAGDPVPDIVVVSAIVAYVSFKQNDYDGWVLVNYPRLYIQASELECALTGYRLLPITDEISTLEDVEGFTFREPCVDPFSRDDFVLNRTSRLVSKPTFQEELPENPKTYFDVFMKLKKINDSSKLQTEESETLISIDEFYTRQQVLQTFEYVTLNFQTVKSIGKIIINEKFKTSEESADLTAKTSLELFGPTIVELNDKWDPNKKKNTKATDGESKKVKPKEGGANEDLEPSGESVQAKATDDSKTGGKKSVEAQPSPVKPGDPEWEWASGNQPDSLLMALASIWENMEAAFIDDLKDVFFCLRTHRSNVLAYCEFIKKSVQNVMRQPDDKQKVLSDFQQMFNEIDVDLRPDLDIKCELHVRVSELEEALLGIADDRKANSLKDVLKVTQDGWVADEMANLVNHFLNIVQLESDRCLTTCQVLMDYYLSLQQKTPDEKPIGKITVAKLQIKDRKYSILSSSPPYKASSSQIFTPKNDLRRSSRLLADQGTRANFERISKTRSWTDKRRRSSEMSFLTGASEVITDILVNLTLPSDGVTPFHNFFRDSVQAATAEITASMEGFISEAKKGDKGMAKNQKKGSETNPPGGGNSAVEWDTALNNELSRFLFRMKLVLARGVFDMNEFLATMLNTLSSLIEEINEMYLKEVKSVSECCKVFKCCIEEEIPVRLQLILKEDDFFVDEDILPPKQEDSAIEQVFMEDKFSFSVFHLRLLFEKLSRVAPDGEIIKRSLLFILEDLRAFNPEIKNCDCFPEAWKYLNPSDMVLIMNEIYQDLEIVHWKDFIIYALDIPIPSESDILSMRKLFRDYDPCLTELVAREDYEKINFWFQCSDSKCSIAYKREEIKDLLFKMYQVDSNQTNYSALLLAFCKDENPIFGFTKALALVLGKKINTNEYASELIYTHGESGEGEEQVLFENYDGVASKKPRNCPSLSTENYGKCIPKEKIMRCLCGDTQTSNNTSEDVVTFSETWGSEAAEQAEAETCPFYYSYQESEQESVVSSVPYAILSSLLKASFPSLSQLSALLDCKQTFQDSLNSIYDSLESKDDRVEVYKLLRHKFVSRLIQSTNKFRYIKVKEILMNTLKSKNSLGSSSCFLDNVTCNMCLD